MSFMADIDQINWVVSTPESIFSENILVPKGKKKIIKLNKSQYIGLKMEKSISSFRDVNSATFPDF